MKTISLLTLGIFLSIPGLATAAVPTLNPAALQPVADLSDFNLAPPQSLQQDRTTRADEDEDEDVWVVAGTGQMTDFVFAQHWGLDGMSFEVTIERNLNDENCFRIPEPFLNWNDPRIADKLSYNAENAEPMVFHVAKDKFAWFDEFETGYTIVTPPDNAPYTGNVSVISSAYRLIGSNGMDRLDQILSMVPGFFIKVSRQILTLAPTATFGADVQYTVMMGVEMGEQTYEEYTKWYFAANQFGDFRVELPEELNFGPPEIDEKWTEIGQGIYTDVILSSLFQGIEPAQIPVVFEQSGVNPNRYRIQAPYANWANPELADYVTFNPKTATPMIFNVIDDKYVYFEEFETGLSLNYQQGGSTLRGQITLLQQAEGFMETYGMEYTLDAYPSFFCKLQDGNMTIEALTFLVGKPLYTLLCRVGSTNYRANTDGDFLVKLPGAGPLDVNAGWTPVGKAAYTDAFTYIFSGVSDHAVNKSELFQTWDVEIQMNNENHSLFRLVNPYKGWKNVYSDVASYDNDHNYYIYIYTLPEENKAAIGVFYTGLNLTGYGKFGVYSDLGAAVQESGIKLAYINYPTLFGDLEDDAITMPAEVWIEDNLLGSFYGWFGFLSTNSTYYLLNEEGNFKITFPFSGVDSIVSDSADTEPIYFNLQGIRLDSPKKGQIVIRKTGDKVQKVIAQ